MKYIFIPIVLIFLSSHQPVHKAYELIGTFDTEQWGFRRQLILSADSTYKLVATLPGRHGGFGHSVAGRFTSKNDKIILTPLSHRAISSRHTLKDSLVVNDSTCPFSGIVNECIEFDTLQILKWRGKLFVLGANQGPLARKAFVGYSNDIVELLNIYNRKPSKFENPDLWYGDLDMFMHKECDDCSEKDLKKALDNEWSDYLIDQPIKSRITKVEKAEDGLIKNRVILNKGTSSHVRAGMRFYPSKGDQYTKYVTVTNVHKDYSVGTIIAGQKFKPKVDLEMTTGVD